MTKEKPIEAKHIGCINCGGSHEILPMETVIAAGFGDAYVTKNAETIYSCNDIKSGKWGDFMTVAQAEELAAKDPEHD